MSPRGSVPAHCAVRPLTAGPSPGDRGSCDAGREAGMGELQARGWQWVVPSWRLLAAGRCQGTQETRGVAGGGGISHQGSSRQPFQPHRSWSGRQGDDRSDSLLGESRGAPFPCIGMIFRSGVATSLPWRSLHPVPETRRELGRGQGAFWKELLMAVSSPHPHQLPSPGTWAQGSRWLRVVLPIPSPQMACGAQTLEI